MFPFLPVLKWYEWALMGALCLFAIALYVLGNQYLELRDTHATVNSQSKGKDTVISKQKEIADLTDRLVADALAVQTENERVLVVTRRGVIDEYLNPAPKPVVRDDPPALPEPAVVPEPTVAENGSVPDKPVAPTVRPPLPGKLSVDRLNRLSERMYERYCDAAGTDAYCPNPPSPAQ